MIAAVVLAAGRSTRMGPINKLLTKLPSGKTMIAQTVANVMACSAGAVIVVTGHEADAIQKALHGSQLRFVHAADYANGISASLRAGIAALPADTQAALVCLGDMPLVGPDVLNAMIGAYGPGKIVAPSFGNIRGNPVLWDRQFFPELLALSGDTGGKYVLQDHAESVVDIEVATDAVLRDFDTPESLAAFAK